MDHDDAVGRRVYGTDHDDPNPGPRPQRTYRELLGGPLDGQLLDVTDRMPEELFTGALLIAPLGMYGPGGRAGYGPREDDPFGPWIWGGDTP
ncbi:hypothetical protein ACFWHQ_31975 [Streptomyces sp. NPDC060334]|uniref:hypothetical protein n=1 Tax=unclassified Streptomyces TaxID=2593676 RepID=UPI00364FFF61